MSFPVVCRLCCPLPGDNQLLHQLPHLLLGKSTYHMTTLYHHKTVYCTITSSYNVILTSSSPGWKPVPQQSVPQPGLGCHQHKQRRCHVHHHNHIVPQVRFMGGWIHKLSHSNLNQVQSNFEFTAS